MKALKKPLSLLMALLMCFGVFAGTGVTAFAAGETMTTYMVDIPRASDPNKAGWGHPAFNFLGGWSTGAADHFSVHTQDSFNGKAIYCIEPGIGVKTGDQYTGRGEDFWDNYPSHLNPTIPPSTIKEYIGRIMTYGWQGNADTSWNSNNPDDANEMAGYIAKVVLTLDSYEHGIMIRALNELRNDMLEEQRDPGPVEDVLLKTIDAPAQKDKKAKRRDEAR